ncbi:hypothetical protein B0B52_17000 [Polaromonas sp. A23]|nr:hypothetical protein B0B52_17000 [Polaromonas sp. A23]
MAGPVLAQTTVAGTTPGQFSVNESGAATYSIPIQVPPGVAGMQPRLSLEYNSQGGNGLLGMGWNLSGLSVITRCPRTMAQDGVRGGVNYDMNDRYCLDGQRLILMSGTYGSDGSEYRTERDSFSRIIASGTAGNGVASFTVRSKAGLTMEYGNTIDSRIEAQDKPTVRVWAINKISDVKTNFMTFAYIEDNANGEYYPDRVDYTGNATAGQATGNYLQFISEERPDVRRGFLAGSVYKSLKRLTRIKTYGNGGTAVKDYVLTYQQSASTSRSRLAQLTECDGQVASACLPPTNLTWTDTTDGEFFGAWSHSSALSGADDAYSIFVVDVNGDGLADLVQTSRTSAALFVSINPGNGYFSSWTYTSGLTGPANDYTTDMVDVNGDGLPDLVHMSRTTNALFVSINPGNGNFQTWSHQSGLTGAANSYATHFVDVNGDGLTDLVHMSRTTNALHVSINPGNGYFSSWSHMSGLTGAANSYATHFADVNGDGLADMVHLSRTTNALYVSYNPGNGYFSTWNHQSSLTGAADAYNTHLVDVDGDGLADLVQMSRSQSGLFVSINIGNGTFSAWSHSSNLTGPADSYAHHLVDLNGDGLVDMLSISRGDNASWVTLNPGNGYFYLPHTYSTTLTGAGSAYTHHVADVTGDGLPDIVQFSRIGNALWIGPNFRVNPDLMAVVTSGLQTATTISYAPLTASAVYTKDSGANASVYPKIDLQYPQYVVSTVSTSNGLGGVNTVQYNYGGLKAEQGTGRGSLGFRWMKSKSVANNIESYTEFDQTYPFTGSVTKNETRLPGSGNAGLLKRTINTYAQSPGSAGASVFVYPSQSVEESWDLSGTPYPSSTTSYVYGQSPQYGDPTQITVSNSEGSSKATANEYWPADSNNWILGRLKKASVTSVKP